jgi:hypothetical protein
MEDSSMKTTQNMTARAAQIGFYLLMGVVLCACAGPLQSGGTSWKEEVLLHDGQKIIVQRSQSYGGRSEPGQPGSIKEHTINFALPGSGKAITWVSEYGEDLGRANFQLLAVHVLGGIPYIVATPNLCLSYNKWGRPNPPYVIFKHDGQVWQRIPLEALPIEFKTINVVLSSQQVQAQQMSAMGLVTAEQVRGMNQGAERPEAKTILREALGNAGKGCIKTDYYKGAGWLSPDWFSDQPSLQACLKFCNSKNIDSEFCPCNAIFKEE